MSGVAAPGRVSLREAMEAALSPWRAVAPTILYCARTLAAVTLALYTAFSLQLESPLSSVITVLIVANPVTGALISKSVWRLLGTILGATAAVVLMAVFGQSPMLFAASFSLCIGAACIATTLLRFYKAYGAVLAGYTIIIVCGPAFANPDNVFTSAVARLSAIAVGIVCAAVVFLLTNFRPPARLGLVITALIRSTGAILAREALPPRAEAAPGALPRSQFHDQRAALLAQANGLQEIIEYAAADSYAVARRQGRLRLGAAGLTGTLTSLNPFGGRAGKHASFASEVVPAFEALASLDTASPAAGLERVAMARDRLAARYEAASDDASRAGLDELASLEQAHDLLTRLHAAVSRLILPSDAAHGRHAGVRLRLYRDWPTALRNGARGGIVTMLAFGFWYVTQWTAGPTLLACLVPAACLLATSPSASRASVDFATGTLLAVPASMVCETLLLPQITGFPLLIGVLAICQLPGIWFQYHPRHALRAFGYVVFFNAMISVGNPIRFDDIALFNNWLAFIIGVAALVVVFRALLPANPRRDANRLVRSITAAVARTGRGGSSMAMEVWENLQMQKVARLIQRLQMIEGPSRQWTIDCSFIAIELGRDLMRLRRLLGESVLHPPVREACAAVLAAASRLRHNPGPVASLAHDAAGRLIGNPAALPAERRLAAILHEIAQLIEAIPDFLRPDFAIGDITIEDIAGQDLVTRGGAAGRC